MQRRAVWVRARGRALLGALALACSCAATQAHAEEGAAEPSTELFRQGRQLLNEGRFEQACEKFRASLALKRSPGTLLNVGNCLESEGQLVAALAIFEEARLLAASEPDAQKSALWTLAANEEIASVEPRIPRVTVTTAEPASGVTLDGQPLTAFGEPLRLDPGQHRLEAAAEGKQPFERLIELAEGQSLSVEVPALEPLASPAAVAALPAAAPAVAVEPGPERPSSVPDTGASAPSDALTTSEGASSVWPWVVIGVGGAVFAGGAITGIVALQQHSELESKCPGMECEGNLAAVDRVNEMAITADVLMLTGILAAGVGTTWLLLSDDGSSAALSTRCSMTGCEASVSGRF